MESICMLTWIGIKKFLKDAKASKNNVLNSKLKKLKQEQAWSEGDISQFTL